MQVNIIEYGNSRFRYGIRMIRAYGHMTVNSRKDA